MSCRVVPAVSTFALCVVLAGCAHTVALPAEGPARVLALCSAERVDSSAWLQCLRAVGQAHDTADLVSACRTYAPERERHELCLELLSTVEAPRAPLASLCARAPSHPLADACLYELHRAFRAHEVASVCSAEPATGIELCTRELTFVRDPREVARLCAQPPSTLLRPLRCRYDLRDTGAPTEALRVCAKEQTAEAQAVCFDEGAVLRNLDQVATRCAELHPEGEDHLQCLRGLSSQAAELTSHEGPTFETSTSWPRDRSLPQPPTLDETLVSAACTAALPDDPRDAERCTKAMRRDGSSRGTWPSSPPYDALYGWGEQRPRSPGGGSH